MYKLKYDIIREYTAIPYKDIVEVVNKLPYGSTERVLIQMLFLSGSRIKELDNMTVDGLINAKGQYYISWKLGKKQKGVRIEKLDARFIQEIKHYRNNHKVFGKKLFAVKGESFTRYFTKLRPKLGVKWNERILMNDKKIMKLEHKYLLKGLRKSHSILKFAKNFKDFNDATASVEFTCADMHHSSKNITTRHYLRDYRAIEGEKYAHLEPIDILGQATQTRLMDF